MWTWVIQQDNDPKLRSKSIAEWLQQKKIYLPMWLSQSFDLKPNYTSSTPDASGTTKANRTHQWCCLHCMRHGVMQHYKCLAVNWYINRTDVLFLTYFKCSYNFWHEEQMDLQWSCVASSVDSLKLWRRNNCRIHSVRWHQTVYSKCEMAPDVPIILLWLRSD